MIVPIEITQPQKKSYKIHIDKLPQLEFDNHVAIVTNPTVAKYHLKSVVAKITAPKLEIIEVPDGEEYKSIETILFILDKLFMAKFDRKSTLIALGGGVIGDMTGFAASIYQRGVDFIQMPTTLLAQVDASVGGKTGVNNRYGKNLIGAFYQPKAVYIDPKFLETLPKREFAAGVAEAIKMAVMFDREFFDFIQKSDLGESKNRIELIARSVKLKAKVVNQDEKESGIRAVLNYGHTFGHVIENLTNYNQYLHGEAVAIGMVMANELAIELNLLSRNEADLIKALLKRNNLPTSFAIDSIEDFYEHFYLDKKSSNGNIAFILPNGRIGTHKILKDIPKELVLKVLEKFRA